MRIPLPRFSLRTLFIAITLAAIFLWWLRPNTLRIGDELPRPGIGRIYFYWTIKPRGFHNISSYRWYDGTDVLLQVWPLGWEVPFCVSSRDGVTRIQWAQKKLR